MGCGGGLGSIWQETSKGEIGEGGLPLPILASPSLRGAMRLKELLFGVWPADAGEDVL